MAIGSSKHNSFPIPLTQNLNPESGNCCFLLLSQETPLILLCITQVSPPFCSCLCCFKNQLSFILSNKSHRLLPVIQNAIKHILEHKMCLFMWAKYCLLFIPQHYLASLKWHVFTSPNTYLLGKFISPSKVSFKKFSYWLSQKLVSSFTARTVHLFPQCSLTALYSL